MHSTNPFFEKQIETIELLSQYGCRNVTHLQKSHRCNVYLILSTNYAKGSHFVVLWLDLAQIIVVTVTWGRFKNTYELLHLRALTFSPVN